VERRGQLNVLEIKSRRMRWVGGVTRISEMRNTYFLSEYLKGRDCSEDLGIDGRIILK
jgi:hypothetical protein